MANKDDKEKQELEEQLSGQDANVSDNVEEETIEVTEGEPADDVATDPEPALTEEERLRVELADQKKAYLLLMADFDNYRKRTLREKQDMLKTATERAMGELLPVVDDVERALQMMQTATDVDALREGVSLIYDKFVKYLASQGVKPIESTGEDFDPDFHEAITMFPATDESRRGKVIDTTTRGYMIHDKVLRHAKVVVGQ
mgnify:CR=1 FL=1